MAYIIKNTSGLINTRFTDVGRQKLSEGRLNIQYFQVGDSEICYNAINGYNQSNTFILESAFNAQNTTQQPQTNKMNVKYPYYVNGLSGNTYGLAVQESDVTPIYNVASVRGFFTGDPYQWSAMTLSSYTKTSEWILNTCDYCGSASTFIYSSSCATTSGTPAVGDYAVIYYDGQGGCGAINGNFPILFYKIQGYDSLNNILTFDRALPNFSGMSSGASCCAEIAFESIWPVKVMAATPSNKPKTIDPESPIKILAGEKLKIKNPSNAPANAKDKEAY
jgi:hypothetical protein